MRQGPFRCLAGLFAAALAFAPLTEVQAGPAEDGEVRRIVRRAKKLLDALEYQRARELLEESSRNERLKRARKANRAQMWALLGRARAELGDAMGTDEAFMAAVRLDRKVKLPRSTSPKIRQALERARRNTPEPLPIEPPPEDEPPRPTERRARSRPDSEPKTGAGRPAGKPAAKTRKVTKTPRPEPEGAASGSPAAAGKARGKRRTKATARPQRAKPAPAKTKRSRRSSAGETGGTSRTRAAKRTKPAEGTQAKAKPAKAKHAEAKRARRAAPPPAPAAAPPRISPPWLVGEPRPQGMVNLRTSYANLPASAVVEAMIRRSQSAGFEARTMTRSATIANLPLLIDRARFEIYVRARVGEHVIATGGAVDRPLIVTPDAPPPIAVAWADQPSDPTADVAATATSTTASPPPADEGLSDLLKWGLIGGAGVIGLAAIITLAVVLADPGTGCDTGEQLGCVEVEVLPLLSF